MLIDAHCHLHEFGDKAEQFSNMLILAVSDDYESSIKTIKLAGKLKNVIPAVGVHPWELRGAGINSVDRSIELAVEMGVRVFGEVGLDKRYYRDIYNLQIDAFKRFIRAAEENGMALNIHALDAWRDVLNILERSDVPAAVIHWYTGPLELLERIKDLGYYITVNPAVEVQPKHMEVVRNAPLEILLTESDGPYVYRGIKLEPPMVIKSLNAMSKVTGLMLDEVIELVNRNFKRLAMSAKISHFPFKGLKSLSN